MVYRIISKYKKNGALITSICSTSALIFYRNFKIKNQMSLEMLGRRHSTQTLIFQTQNIISDSIFGSSPSTSVLTAGCIFLVPSGRYWIQSPLPS